MATEFYPLKVIKKESLTSDSVCIGFDVPEEIKKRFQFTSGQYLVMEAAIGEEKVRRSYSLCSAPSENKWEVGIKKVPSGKFSTFANEELEVGDQIQVMVPTGNFELKVNKTNENKYVAFAAGSGITPILSMIKSVLFEEPKSEFTLFYGNQGLDSIMFREEIEALKNKYLNRLSVHHVFSREKLGSPLFFGRIDAEKCRRYSEVFFDPEKIEGYYLCGPAAMIFNVKDQLVDIGVDPKKIHFELFSTDGIIKEEKPKEKQVTFDPSTESMVKVILDGEISEFTLSYGGKNILDAALESGLDLPFSCKGGVCSTCKARIDKGEAEMDLNYALEPDELEAGFVLTCQSHPRTSKITVNFDEA